MIQFIADWAEITKLELLFRALLFFFICVVFYKHINPGDKE